MKTIIVDDEPLALDLFEMECRDMPEIEIIGRFTQPVDALDFAKKHPIEFAVLDVEMAELNGIELGKRLKELYPELVLVYVTGYSQYIVETLKIKADYCIMKPYDHYDIEDLVRRAKLLSRRQGHRIKVQMFGRFNIFVDGQVLQISNTKARELLALCFDHKGGIVTMEEAIDKLWPDRDYDERVKRMYRKAIISIQKALREADCRNVFETGRGGCYIKPEQVDCDYYQYLENPEAQKDQFTGEYLFDYDWGEETLANFYDFD